MKGYECEFSRVGGLEVVYVVSWFASLGCDDHVYCVHCCDNDVNCYENDRRVRSGEHRYYDKEFPYEID